ncbi:hypothetical protein E4U58_001928, partial [Claviceps cyperi]
MAVDHMERAAVVVKRTIVEVTQQKPIYEIYNNDSHKSSHPSFEISKTTLVDTSTIPELNSPTDWIQWNKGMRIYLGVNTLSDLLGRNKDPPHVSEIPTDTETTRLDKWYTRQEQACSIVESRLGYNANEIVQKLDKKEVLTWFEALEKEYKPSGNAIFQDLAWKYERLSLENSTDVADFAASMRRIRTELLQLDKSCVIGEP